MSEKSQPRSSSLSPLRRGAHGVLARILDQPDLVRMVQALPPRALGRLIDHVGLEDAGALVALATTEQLARVLDEDLWKSARPGSDETFDGERFMLWIEVMLEGGERFAAGRLTELPEDVITLALHRHALVVSLDALAAEMSGAGARSNLTEKALDSSLYVEIGEYQVIARRHDGWDALVSLLLALDEQHHEFLARLLARCCRASSELIEENGGLYQVLTSEEALESDAGADREDRRAREGFVAPSAAASFLALARTTALDEIIAARTRDPITRMYFRHFEEEKRAVGASTMATEGEAEGVAKLVELLRDAEVLEEARPMLQLGAGAPPGEKDGPSLFQSALVALSETNAEAHAARVEELGYLANVLVAGCGIAGRRFRSVEAVEASVAICNLGLAQLAGAGAAAITRAATLLAERGADQLFRIGFQLLFREVAMIAARTVEAALDRALSTAEPGRAFRLRAIAQAVRAAPPGRRPSVVRGRLEALGREGVLEPRALVTFRALLDECPTLPAPEGDTPLDGLSPREFVLISTHAQLGRARHLAESTSSPPI